MKIQYGFGLNRFLHVEFAPSFYCHFATKKSSLLSLRPPLSLSLHTPDTPPRHTMTIPKQALKGLRVFVISTVWPETRSSAAGVRTKALLDMAFELGASHVACGSPAKATHYKEELSSAGIETIPLRINCDSFDREIRELRPDIVIYDRFNLEEQFGWRVRKNAPTALSVLDTQDLHFIRRSRRAYIDNEPSRTKALTSLPSPEVFCCPLETEVDVADEYTLRELSAIHRSDTVLVVSPTEKNLLVSRMNVPSSKISVSPFYYHPRPGSSPPIHQHKRAGRSFNSRVDLVSIGNFRHFPNEDSVLYMKEKVWPRLSHLLPDARLIIYGAHPLQVHMSLSSPGDRFIVRGPTPDVFNALSKARLLLAPLRYVTVVVSLCGASCAYVCVRECVREGEREGGREEGEEERGTEGERERGRKREKGRGRKCVIEKTATLIQRYPPFPPSNPNLIRYGAGVKGKIADAWYSGTPVVTSPIGAEGMGWPPSKIDVGSLWGGACVNSLEEMISRTASLYSDIWEWEKSQRVGYDLLRNLFDYETHRLSLGSFLSENIERLKVEGRRDVVSSKFVCDPFYPVASPFLSLSLSFSISLSLFLFLSQSPFLSIYIYIYMYRSISVSHYISLTHSLPIYLSLTYSLQPCIAIDMLWLNASRSSEYMSKYITLKGKLREREEETGDR